MKKTYTYKDHLLSQNKKRLYLATLSNRTLSTSMTNVLSVVAPPLWLLISLIAPLLFPFASLVFFTDPRSKNALS